MFFGFIYTILQCRKYMLLSHVVLNLKNWSSIYPYIFGVNNFNGDTHDSVPVNPILTKSPFNWKRRASDASLPASMTRVRARVTRVRRFTKVSMLVEDPCPCVTSAVWQYHISKATALEFHPYNIRDTVHKRTSLFYIALLTSLTRF